MAAMSRARIGLSVPPELPPADIPACAQRAESAGFDELWLAEDCFFAGDLTHCADRIASLAGRGINRWPPQRQRAYPNPLPSRQRKSGRGRRKTVSTSPPEAACAQRSGMSTAPRI